MNRQCPDKFLDGRTFCPVTHADSIDIIASSQLVLKIVTLNIIPFSVKEITITICNVRSTKKTLGDRTLTVAAPSVLNALLRRIRQENDFNRFKSLLKTHLFEIAYCK